MIFAMARTHLGASLHTCHRKLIKHGPEPLVAGLVKQLIDPVQVDHIRLETNTKPRSRVRPSLDNTLTCFSKHPSSGLQCSMGCQGNCKELSEVAEGGLRFQNFNNSCSGDLIIGVLDIYIVFLYGGDEVFNAVLPD